MEHDIAFHEAIAAASQNPMFALIVSAFSVVTRRTWRIGWVARSSQRRPARDDRRPQGHRRGDPQGRSAAGRRADGRALRQHRQSAARRGINCLTMKITAIETIRLEEFANLLWLRVHTDEGLVGLGETFFLRADRRSLCARVDRAQGCSAAIRSRSTGSPRTSSAIVGFRSTGAEVRGNSALDIALWDLFGKVTGQPIAQLLGGFSRQRIRTYNTCAGTAYMRTAKGQTPANWGLGAEQRLRRSRRLPEPRRRARLGASRRGHHGHEDLAVRHRRGEERRATTSRAADLKTALAPFEKIRSAVGDKMDIMVEFHSMWQLLPAMTIAKALAPLRHLLARGPDQDGQPRRPPPLRRGLARADLRLGDARHAAGPFAISSRPVRPASSCSTSPGAAACRRRARSPRWRRPGTCRSRRTTAPARSCSAPRRICR